MPAEQLLNGLPGPGRPQFHPSRCSRVRYNHSSCRRCVQICPSGAIAIDQVSVISSACRNCLLCEAVCPNGALRGGVPELPRRIAELSRCPQPLLGCRQAGGEAHARLSCLGLLADPELLLVLVALFPRGLNLNLSRCAECDNAAILPQLEQALEQLRQLLGPEMAGRLRLVRDPAELDFRPLGISRRELFGLLKKGSVGGAAALLEQLQPPGEGLAYRSKEPPPVRVLLLKTLRQLPEEFRQVVAERWFWRLQIAAACEGCSACVGLCPTGALRIGPGQMQPEGLPQLCSNCGLCEEFCPAEAICWDRRSPLEDPS